MRQDTTRHMIAFLLLFTITAGTAFAIDQKTGTATWSTPLSTLKGTSVSLPVALSHASPARRDDLASWVGNGWRLDMPYIERIVSGGPDDAENSTQHYNSNTMSSIAQLRSDLLPNAADDTLLFSTYKYDPLVWRKYVWSGDPLEIDHIQTGSRYRLQSTNYNYCGQTLTPESAASQTFEDGDMVCDGINNTVMQDSYMLRNFPKGNCQLFFVEKPLWGDSLPVATTPYKPWRVDYDFTVPPASPGPNGVTTGDFFPRCCSTFMSVW